MALMISPSIAARSRIEAASGAVLSPCWTCSTCDQECPMNRSTGRLRPQKIVRMATLGLLEEMVSIPDIWYCLSCRRCTNVCPNRVHPESLIQHLRREAVCSGVVSVETYRRMKSIYIRFQRARHRLAADLLRGKTPSHESDGRFDWRKPPPPVKGHARVVRIASSAANGSWRAEFGQFQLSACFTCSECSNACPISGNRDVFDPQWIFRMANLGQMQPLLTSAAIWLCIECERCSDACGQLVQGHRAIRFLRQQAVGEGHVPHDFPFRWSHAQRWIYPDFVAEIDSLLAIPG